MLYHILGFASAALFLLTWLGLWSQIKAMTRYQVHVASNNDDANHSLSLNQFGSSYFAFFSIFLFGISGRAFQPLLGVDTIWRAHLRSLSFGKYGNTGALQFQAIVAAVALLALVGGTLSIAFRPFPTLAQLGANTLMLVVTVILFQGSLHQWFVLQRRQKVGSLSFALFRNILIKDVSTLLFGLTMPLSQSWPLLILNGTSVIMRGSILLQMHKLKRREFPVSG